MKVLVIGATGKTGRLAVERAVEVGHSVVALVHDTEHLKDDPLPQGVTLASGDVHDVAFLTSAMQGCEAVIDALGGKTPFLKTDLESKAAEAVLQAMAATGARRLVVISVLGAGDSGKQAPGWYEHILAPVFLHGAIPDKNAMEAEVKASDVEWVVVRPPILTDGEATGMVKVVGETETAHKITRGDLAQFLVEQLTSDVHLRSAVVVANS